MKKLFILFMSLVIIINLVFPSFVVAREGDCGYEGGISSGEVAGKTLYDYQEVCFLSGEPVVFKGTLTIKKSTKASEVLSTYTYSLKNLDRAATFTRMLTLDSKVTDKDNGQTIEETSLSGRYSEVIRIGSLTYTLKKYDFTRSNLIDHKPAIDYYAGNLWGRKTYQVIGGAGASASSGVITVEETGNFYGYNQYWGTAQVQTLSYIVDAQVKKGSAIDTWGGTADINLSSSTTKEISYVSNKPGSISFSGGYVQTQHNESIMEYNCSLPEFDKNGISTDNILDKKDSLKLESFPVQTRLPTPQTSNLKGQWAENDINTLFSLEVITGKGSTFRPEAYITRAEFASVINNAAKPVPIDTTLSSKIISTTSTKGNAPVISAFNDVKVANKYFTAISSVYSRGIMSTKSSKVFSPNTSVTVADAIVVFIKALGLESMAPQPVPVTTFKDNSKIPTTARASAYVAEQIGLIEADSNGYLHPTDKLTNAKAAVMINGFINYMRSGIIKDYKDRLVNY